MYYISGNIKPIIGHYDSQIYVCNFKYPAEKDLLCQAHAKHLVIKFLFDFLVEDA